MFVVHGPVRPDSPVHVERRQELDTIARWLDQRGSVGVVLGARQTGKTSMCYALMERFGDRAHFVYIDFQGFPGESWNDCAEYVAEQIAAQLDIANAGSETPPLPRRAADLSRFLVSLASKATAARIMVIFEELGLLPDDCRKRLGQFIRSVFTSRIHEPAYERYAFLILGAYELRNVAGTKNSPLWNVADKIYLVDFSRQQVDGLLNGAIHMAEPPARRMADFVYQWTSGHPYWTQRMARELVTVVLPSSPEFTDDAAATGVAESLLQCEDTNLPQLVEFLDLAGERLWQALAAVLEGKLAFTRFNRDVAELELCGAIVNHNGSCRMRNRIYEQVVARRLHGGSRPARPQAMSWLKPPTPAPVATRYRKLEWLFDAVIELDESERGEFLEKACAGDNELRQELDALLASDRPTASGLLDDILSPLITPPEPPPEPKNLELADTQGAKPADGLPAPGEHLANYVILRELDRGAMGAVYLARDEQLHRRVAIKFLLHSEPQLVRRFQIEARALARCEDVNIVAIHDFGDYNGKPYMVLQYSEGQTLHQWLRGRKLPLSPEQAVERILPVVKALVHAHDAGIIHRDLKPANILVTDTDDIKVLDFGLAKFMHDSLDLTNKGAILGTFPYMSPEQWGVGDMDHRSDLWAVGIMLFELAVGHHPLAPVSMEKLFAVREPDSPMPSARDAAPALGSLADVIDGCLIKPKDRRMTSAKVLLSRLEEWLRGSKHVQTRET